MDTALLDLIKQRRTVRKFTDQAVTDEQLHAVLEAAVCAPTRLDVQPWHFVVLRDKALQKKLSETVRLHAYLETAPVVIAVWGEPERTSTWLMDCCAAIENLLLAAQAVGLGGAWVGGPEISFWEPTEELLRREIGAPQEVRLVSLVALGVPAAMPQPHGKERWNRFHMHLGKWNELWEWRE
jgi:nitroreductase